MSQKRKPMAMAAAAMMSAVLLVTTATVAASNVSGYEKLKESVFKTAQLKNATIQLNTTVSYNYEVVFENNTVTAQETGTRTYTSSTTKVGGEEISITETSNLDGHVVHSFDKDTYQTYDIPAEAITPPDELNITDNQKKLANIVFDLFAGNTKNYFTQEDGHIKAKLEKRQIPEFFQALTSVFGEAMQTEKNSMHSAGMDTTKVYMVNADGVESDTINVTVAETPSYAPMNDMADLEEKMLNLSNEMVIESVYVDAVVNDEHGFEYADFSFLVSGKDKNGETHYLTVNMTMEISNIGSTVAKTVDTTGKTQGPSLMDEIRVTPEEE